MHYKTKNKIKHLSKRSQGFSAVEWIICALLLGIIFANLGRLIVSSLNNGKFVQIVADTASLSTQKATELFNDSKNQAAKIPEGQTKIGSIDPNKPVDGYFDLFNDSACLLRNYAQAPPEKITIDNVKNSFGSNVSTTLANDTGKESAIAGKGRLPGDLGSDDSGGTLSRLDCSTSTFREPSQSLEPKFRRQWLILKDFPNKSDITYSVIVVYLERNKVVRLNTITKTDGAISK